MNLHTFSKSNNNSNKNTSKTPHFYKYQITRSSLIELGLRLTATKYGSMQIRNMKYGVRVKLLGTSR